MYRCLIRLLHALVTGAVLLLFSGCVGIPKGISPVTGFDLSRYLGKWYEIARLDHSFERGLERVTAEYALRDDGGVSVVNRGYSVRDKSWEVAEGKAYFVSESDVGHLKVSFFGPFYGAYVIFEVEETDYQYAFVTSYDKSYLWLLSRTQTANQGVIDRFLRLAKKHGFNTEELIFVDHT